MNGLTAHKCHLYREWTRQGWYQLLWNTTGLHKLLGFTWQKAPFFISIKKNSFVQVRHVFPSKTAVSDPVFMNHLFHRWKVWATLSSLFRSSHHSLPDLCPNPPPTAPLFTSLLTTKQATTLSLRPEKLILFSCWLALSGLPSDQLDIYFKDSKAAGKLKVCRKEGPGRPWKAVHFLKISWV